MTEASENLRELVSKFASQGPRVYRTERAKVEYICDAVIENGWAGSALSEAVAADKPNFQWLFAELDAA